MSKTIANHRRVLDYDTDCGDGYIVTLQRGFAWDDAVSRPEDDPEGATACHVRRFETVREFQQDMATVERCYCGRCSRTQPN